MSKTNNKVVYLVVQTQEDCGYKKEAFFATLDEQVAIKTCREHNRAYGTPELLDANFDFCPPDDYDWCGGESYYEVVPLVLEDKPIILSD